MTSQTGYTFYDTKEDFSRINHNQGIEYQQKETLNGQAQFGTEFQ
jgi:hypothetical protein